MSFCTETNLPVCFEWLSSQLFLLDFPKITYDPSSDKKNSINLVNTCWYLVNELKEKNKSITTNYVEIANLTSVNKQLHSQTRNSVSPNLANESNALRSKLAASYSENGKLLVKIKLLEKECKRLVSSVNVQKKLHSRELADQNGVITHLKRCLSSPNQENVRDEVDSAKLEQDITIKKSEKISLENCIRSLDESVQYLMNENASIRCSLLKVYMDVKSKCEENCIPLPEECSANEIENLIELRSEEFLEKVNDCVSMMVDILGT